MLARADRPIAVGGALCTSLQVDQVVDGGSPLGEITGTSPDSSARRMAGDAGMAGRTVLTPAVRCSLQNLVDFSLPAVHYHL
jgi:hypothetical protein